MKIIETKDGLILEILVKPRSADFRIVIEGEDVIISCREEPVKGKVNKEIIKELSKILEKKVELVSGFFSKQKRLLIKGATRSEVEHVLLSETG
jgi:uncharacterized protein (TIGR00251 family)